MDFCVVCQKVLPHVTNMIIDEEKKYILTNYEKARNGGKTSDTDHATEYIDLNLKIVTEKPKRVEVWNFKNHGAQAKFQIQTSETNDFSSCFEDNLPILKPIKNWRDVFETHCRNSFKKILITKKKKAKRSPARIS